MKNIIIQQNIYQNNLSKKYIPYGNDDNYGNELINLLNSSTHNALIELKKRCLNNFIPFLSEELNILFKGTGKDAGLLEKIIMDKLIFNGFGIKVKKYVNTEGVDIMELTHIPFNKLRLIEKDGFVDSVCVLSFNGKKNKIYPFYKQDDIDTIESILYNKAYSVNFNNYPEPTYKGAINAINSDIEISRFILSNIYNGFNPSVIIHIPNKPLDEYEQYKLEKEIQEFGKGAVNGSSILLTYGDGENKVEVIPYNSSTNVDLYNNVIEIIKQNIYTSHGLTSPTLAGIPGTGSLGGNSNELETAFNLFRKSVLEPISKEIEESINILDLGEKLTIEITQPI